MKGFPIDQIRATDKVLCLFSAAFLGKNDVQHIYDKGVRDCTIVDLDRPKLHEMYRKYHYKFHCGDAFDFIDNAFEQDKRWDVVICDQWSTMDDVINLTYIMKLQCITRRVLIVGCGTSYLDLPGSVYYYRSDFNGGTYWRVICK